MREYNDKVTTLAVESDDECGSWLIVRVATDVEDTIRFAEQLDSSLGFCEARDFRVNGVMLARWRADRNQEVLF